ncbi:preprotein translocase subunit SecY [Floccifex sp.]|uniref:preprotein translocase subunit SecY n=1 Tax=Floccifex sp. TaxID=2815810 RepID=UPI003F03A78A
MNSKVKANGVKANSLGFFGTIKAMFTNKEIRNRILFTLFAFLVYRLGCAITVPNVNTSDLVAGMQDNSFFAMINLLGGGGLEQFSVFALGVTPYITASIIIQLLSMDVIPHLTELSKSGASGRKTLDKYTRYLAVVFGFVQSFSLVYGLSKSYTGLLVGGSSIATILYIATIFTAGTMFLVWIGDQISMKGIGNGISMIIMAGIVGRLPQQFSTAYSSLVSGSSAPDNGILLFVLYIIIYLLIIIFVTLINTAERRIPIQQTSSSLEIIKNKNDDYLPLKVNSASVIPVIFASSLMMAPLQIASFFDTNDFIRAMNNWLGLKTWYSLVIYVLLIIFFTFFYTKMQINPEEFSKNLAKSGQYIPGVRPGRETQDYVNKVLSRITVFGALALALIAVLPHLMTVIWPEISSTMALGGTGMIIVVGVALETIKQVQGLITQKSYKDYY